MKIAIITDTHCGSGNDNKHLNEYFLQFYENVFFPYLVDSGIKTVVHLGDVFDRRKYINFNTLNLWRSRVFDKLNSICDRVDILIGNHDTYYKHTNSVNSVIELLSIYDNFNFYENSKEVFLDNVKTLYVPWICSDNSEHSLNMINDSDAKLCMGHLELAGFELYAGRISESGMSSKLFDKFFMTLSGHYHQKSSKSDIHYLGAPYPMMWGDYNCRRGFHVLDTETLDLTFIRNENEMFRKLEYNDSNGIDIEQIISSDYSSLSNKFVKIIVKSKLDPYAFDKFFECVQLANPADLSVVEAIFDTDSVESVDVDETKDTLTILNDFVDIINVSKEDANGNDLKSEKLKSDVKNKIREVYFDALSSNEHIQSNS